MPRCTMSARRRSRPCRAICPLRDAGGDVQIEIVRGDAKLKRVAGSVAINKVAGDLVATDLDGGLAINNVGGDASIADGVWTRASRMP